MRCPLAAFLAAALLATLPALADQKNPKPKNKQEIAALQAVQAAGNDPDAQLKAITNVLENFADTDYKPMLISMAMQAAQQKDDMGLVTTWTQRALQDYPDNIEAHVVLAEATARHTRENDLNKDDSIKTIQTNANQALTLLKSANTAPPGVPDAQWPGLKSQLTAEAYEALGIAAEIDKKFPDAVADFKMGVAADPAGTVVKARLTKAYVDNKQYDEAIATANEIIADPQAQPVVKQMAQQQKDFATKMKAK
jgi:tetratricopeptide (TPR) repeat protein